MTTKTTRLANLSNSQLQSPPSTNTTTFPSSHMHSNQNQSPHIHVNGNIMSGYQPFREMNTEIRHGFAKEMDEQHMDFLASNFFLYFDDKRHHTNGNPITDDELKEKADYYQPISDWKIMRDRQKTVSAAIVLCLNIGVDPPDVIKTHPSAKTEAWIDPLSFSDPKKGLEAIGKNLQTQYETLSLKTRYKQSLDPCVEDMKRFCNSLRRNARDERIMFHYNGHGVPQPTQSGEIWVFNRGYTQYIPISLYDLQTWLGAPCIYVYDCNSAGNIVSNFKKFVQKRIDDDNDGNHDNAAPSPTSSYIDCIQLAACRANELLPMDPELPADLFTCCLTCPIDISILWFIMQSPIKKSYYGPLLELARNNANNNNMIVIPGKLTDRRTPLGELNWIFTAITDTIAWTSLPRPLFKRLFRQDLMVAALFRNFLLAKRIMPSYGCHPISDPPLPDIQFHTMWESWDLAIDQVLTQLLKNLNNETISQSLTVVGPDEYANDKDSNTNGPAFSSTSSSSQALTLNAAAIASSAAASLESTFQHSSFFEQNLTAFELWLKYGSNTKNPPEQLPIVLQVLLSQVHRVRALVLLSKFLDLGPWAVYLALSIGIFPYILKLLQSPSNDLKPVLIFIWARIMAVDYKNTQQELIKDKGFNYFLQMLNPRADSMCALNTNNDHKASCALILSLFTRGFKNAQKLCFTPDLIDSLLLHIENSDNPLLRQWCVLLMSNLWESNFDAKWICSKEGYLERLLRCLNDPIPEVRTSIILALTSFLPDETTEEETKDQTNLIISVLPFANDASPLVRKEFVILVSKIVHRHIQNFVVLAYNEILQELSNDLENKINGSNAKNNDKQFVGYGTIYHILWKTILILSTDGHTQIRLYAEKVLDYILIKLRESPLQHQVNEMEALLVQKKELNDITANNNFTQRRLPKPIKLNGRSITESEHQTLQNERNRRPSLDDTDSSRSSSGFSLFKRTISLSLKSLVWGSTEEGSEADGDSSASGPGMPNMGINRQDKRNFLSNPHGTAPVPKVARFDVKEFNEEFVELPLVSTFFGYSIGYFQEPQMRKSEVDEPGSLEYTQRIWRRNRNENIINETQPQKNLSLRGDWKTSIATLNNKTQPKILKFSQFENYLVTSDDRDILQVFDWRESRSLSRFSNGNKFGTKITDLKLLNEDDLPLLMTGSSDGIVQIYKDFHDPEAVKLVTSWRVLTDLLLTPRSAGVLLEWQQSRGSLLATGDVKIIRIWDAPRELCVVDVPARCSSSITSLTSDQVAGNVFVGGFSDGSIRVYDRRLDPRDSMVKLWKTNGKTERSSPIQNVHMQRGGYRELVSGSNNSSINLWDIRLDEPVVTFKSNEVFNSKTGSSTSTLTACDIHEHAPIIVTGSKQLKIYTTSGDELSSIKNQTAFMSGGFSTSSNNSYISSLALHPHRMMVAANNLHDPYINIYNCTDSNSD